MVVFVVVVQHDLCFIFLIEPVIEGAESEFTYDDDDITFGATTS